MSTSKNSVCTISTLSTSEIDRILLEVGPLLRDLRRQRGISQTKLSSSSTLSQQQISRIENNEFTPNLDTLIKYLHGLGIDFSDLLKQVAGNKNTTHTT